MRFFLEKRPNFLFGEEKRQQQTSLRKTALWPRERERKSILNPDDDDGQERNFFDLNKLKGIKELEWDMYGICK